MEIKQISFSEWEKLWPLSKNDNLLQSWFYGIAKENSEKLEVLYFSISKEDNEIALVQLLVKKLPILGKLARLNRGPIFLINQNQKESIKDLENILKLIILECKRRKVRMIKAAPEIISNENSHLPLLKNGFSKISSAPWSSGLINLKEQEEILLKNLNGKWRNCYRKSIKLGVTISKVENNFENLSKLIKSYKNFQLKREFNGLSGSFIKELSKFNHADWKFNIFHANINSSNEPIGKLVTIHHGKTAIYLIGATNLIGRKNQANYSLLWDALIHAKKSGCEMFDIGGLGEETPKGIAHFKKGLNAKNYQLIGEWRKFIFPKFF